MKVLVIAFAIKPGGGSESAVGWTWVNEIAKVADHVTVLVRDAEGQRAAIEESLRTKPLRNVEFVYYELPGFLKKMVKGETHTKQTGMRRYYLVWQFYSIFFLKRKLSLKTLNIIHHVTFPIDWIPSFYTLLGIKRVVLGPLGSNSFLPYALHHPAKVFFKNLIANSIKFILRWLNPLFRYNMIRADALIGISAETRRKIGTRLLAKKFYHIPGVSVPEELKPNPVYFPKSVPPRGDLIIFSACPFIYLKNVDLSIEAFYEYRKINLQAKFFIAGGGPLKEDLLALRDRLGLKESIIFLGWIKREEVFHTLRDSAHILLFPTSESGGTVSIEAMRCGVPVVCLEGYGYNYFVKDSRGSIAVPIHNRSQVIKGIADALDSIARKLPEYSRYAYEESESFLPIRKRELIRKIYGSFM